MSTTASHGGAMGHYLRIHDDYDEIRLALVCTAAPGSPCRLRPADGRRFACRSMCIGRHARRS